MSTSALMCSSRLIDHFYTSKYTETTNDINDNLGPIGVAEHTEYHSAMAFLNYSQIFETNCVFLEEYPFSTLDHSLGIE